MNGVLAIESQQNDGTTKVPITGSAIAKRGSRRLYSAEFKLYAVSVVVYGRRRPCEVADFFNLSVQSLQHWISKYNNNGSSAFSKQRTHVTLEAMELSWLRAENARLQAQLQILKYRLDAALSEGESVTEGRGSAQARK